ncbi:LOW QUALITY PROTEIN: trichohyalin-like protein 1 [Glossophaga mutica]
MNKSPGFVKMPRLLRDVLCVIETFHKYARENGDEVTLTCRELKRLIQSEFGDILQPRVIHAVERNLNLLALDNHGTISFNEFVLTIFNLLNLHYLDIQSLLNPEPRQVSNPEEKPDDMEAHETVVQEESERKTQPPALKGEAQDGKYQVLQESSKERDEEASKTQELCSEEYQNHPETEGVVTPGKEARHEDEGTAETLVSNKNAPAAKKAPGARERVWELSSLENQSGGVNKRVTKTHDKPIKEDDGNQGEDPEPTVTENDKRSSETPNSLTPDDGNSSTGISDLLLREDSQSQVDSLRESAQGSRPNIQKQVALGKKNRTQEAAGGEDEQLTKEQEQPEGKQHRIQGSAMKGPGPAVEPSGRPEAQTHLETEKLVTLEEEDKSPQKLSGEVDDQQNPAKKEHDSSIFQSGLEERTQRSESCSAERGIVFNPLYKYLQEKILQQTHTAKKEHQNQVQTSRISGPEPCNDQFSNEISDCLVFFNDS